LTVPPETVEKFHLLVDQIKASPSMDDDERQYWVDVLPIMSEPQLQNLRDILGNEKKQREAVQQIYDKAKTEPRPFDEEAYLEKKYTRQASEKQEEKVEAGQEDELLKALNQL